MNFPHIILASNSPRRSAVLEQLGIPHSVCPSNIEEISNIGDPELRTCFLAEQKAKATKTMLETLGTYKPDSIILAADTVVVIPHENNTSMNPRQILEKPSDIDDARRMILSLSGKNHLVYTGHCLIQNEKIQVDCEITQLSFVDIEEHILAAYLDSMEWEGVSGGYKIQGLGAIFVSSIHGNYSNVMGLSIPLLMKYLKSLIT